MKGEEKGTDDLERDNARMKDELSSLPVLKEELNMLRARVTELSQLTGETAALLLQEQANMSNLPLGMLSKTSPKPCCSIKGQSYLKISISFPSVSCTPLRTQVRVKE